MQSMLDSTFNNYTPWFLRYKFATTRSNYWHRWGYGLIA